MGERLELPNVFRCDGEFWTIAYEKVTCHLRHTRGLRLLAVLLSRPGELVLAAELLGIVAEREDCGTTADGTARERARVRATRLIKGALRRIAQHVPALGDHFASTVRTGHRCTYFPDPRVAIVWETSRLHANPDRRRTKT